MGSCVSVHKDPESATKLPLSFGSKNDNLVIPSPEEKTMVADAAVKSQWSMAPSVTFSRDFGSKEETFFDSHPWLESDCEDDFFSVNGDYTPSRGNTPVHHSFSAGTPQANRNLFAGKTSNSTPEPSPTDKKKSLSELFNDGTDQDPLEQNVVINPNGVSAKTESKTTTLEIPPKSTSGTPYMSGANSICSSERSPNGDLKSPVEKSTKLAQCCLPRLRTSRSFSEKKKRTNPAPSLG